MENNIYRGSYQGKNTICIENMSEVSLKISQILSFSKVAMLAFVDEYFEFGKELKHLLLQRGIKVIDIILADNFSVEKDKFDDFLSLPEDVRGIIAFNAKIIPLVCSNYLTDKMAFFIERGVGYGLGQNTYFLKDKDLLIEIPKNERLYIMLFNDKNNLDSHIKCACVYVNMLIDYFFRQNILKEDVDMPFFNKVKSILVDILFTLKVEGEKRKKEIIENLFLINQMLANKDCYYSCSATISSFLTNNDFFDLDCSFKSSKLIIEKYDKTFNKELTFSPVDYSEIAKALCFLTGIKKTQILSTVDSVVKKINVDNLIKIKTELKKLILLYNDLCKNFKKKISFSDFDKQNLIFSISLSGFTPFGINGMTALQE